jgi:hypothetical protein
METACSSETLIKEYGCCNPQEHNYNIIVISYFYSKTEKLLQKTVLIDHKVPERNASHVKEEKLITILRWKIPRADDDDDDNTSHTSGLRSRCTTP